MAKKKHSHKWTLAKYDWRFKGRNHLNSTQDYSIWVCPCGARKEIDYDSPK